MRILNLGNGKDLSIAGAVMIDRNPDTSLDVVHDLNKIPWRFDEGTSQATLAVVKNAKV